MSADGCEQLQLLAWAELLSLATGAVAEAASASTAIAEADPGQRAAPRRTSAGWSGWDANAATDAAGGAAAPSKPAEARAKGAATVATDGAPARSAAFAAMMALLLRFFQWRSCTPEEPITWPPERQVGLIPPQLAICVTSQQRGNHCIGLLMTTQRRAWYRLSCPVVQ